VTGVPRPSGAAPRTPGDRTGAYVPAGALLPLLPAEYVLPMRWTTRGDVEELTSYLATLAGWVPVTVVDGSPTDLFDDHRRRWSAIVRHLPPEPWPGGNGKVAGVMTGVRVARADCVVIADDDVRYGRAQLSALVALLAGADLVRPQNYFDPAPWHSLWDTARSLVNRGLGADYPGTLGVRRSTLLLAGGYAGDALFENLELIRTVRAVGGVELRADDLYVARRPSTVRHFWSQRVRQAYDSFAQPGRLAVELALLPGLVAAIAVRPRAAVAAGIMVVLVAERGRRRRHGTEVFPVLATLLAPCWLVERAVCSWLALAWRLHGGVRYAGARLPRAASSMRSLRRRLGGIPHPEDRSWR